MLFGILSLSTVSLLVAIKVDTPIHESIRELVTWECKEHGVNIMNVLANPKRKCWELESEFLEA
jgi:hypothetical protein